MHSVEFSKFAFCLTVMLSTTLLFSCGNAGIDDPDNPDVPAQNAKLQNTHWVLRGYDYNLGDDWVTLYDRLSEFIFYSPTEGLYYEHIRTYDTDFGNSSDRALFFFTYEVNNSKVSLDYFTPVKSDTPFYLELNKGILTSSYGVEYDKRQLDADTKAFVNTYSGTTKQCKWYYNMQGELLIRGKGEMENYASFSRTPWASYAINNIVIAEGVTNIGDYAFASPSVGHIDLPYSGLKRIGTGALQGSSISQISIPSGIESIGESAFSGCQYLRKSWLPSELKTIENYAFSGCDRLSISLASTENLESIGDYAFLGAKITQWTNSQKIKSIGNGAITDCSVQSITFPESLISLGHLSVHGSYTELHIGKNLKDVTGTPFYPSYGGVLYLDQYVPLNLTSTIIDPNIIHRWTLRVPVGAKSKYQKNLYWNQFGSIIEDSSLAGSDKPEGNGNEDGNNDGSENKDWTEPKTYKIGLKEYPMIVVDGSDEIAPFCIMQTELDIQSEFEVNGHKIGRLDSNGDQVVTKSEFREFLTNLREITGVPFRLPRPNEWKYAAKGGKKSKNYTYSGSNTLSEVGWYTSNSGREPHKFALLLPNELGIYDMSGNYSELCNNSDDLYNVDGSYHGGSWKDDASDCKTTSSQPGKTSGKIPGTNLKEKNAFDGKYITVRFVFTRKNAQ